MSLELDKKYNINVPRYTSYPTVPYWNGAPLVSEWLNSLNSVEDVDLYIHIPYCKSLCYYCGCYKKITNNEDLATQYVDLLIKEWLIYLRQNPNLKISTIHFGGGTPTFLSDKNFERLLSFLSKNYSSNFIGSIELDPRTTNIKQLKVLQAFGFKRASLGIQDFDIEVQETINRVQRIEVVGKVIDDLKKLKFTSINFDLIYGLPKQSKETIRKTIEKVIEFSPDMIAFYSYAHLPSKIPSQRVFATEDLRVGAAKKELYEYGKELLKQSCYGEIGLDHFAKKGSYLLDAANEGRLLRSFMGYTDKKSETMIGLGLSSISQTKQYYAQNTKNFKDYEESILNGDLDFINGHHFSKEDLKREKIIQTWMCQGQLSLNELKSLDEVQLIQKEILTYEMDNLIKITKDNIAITEVGRPFLRVIESSFDEYLRKSNKKVQFSTSL